MSRSFVKYANPSKNGDGRGPLMFSRAHRDGLPFRGPANLMMRENEFADYTETVHDAKIRTFELDKPEDLHDYQEVLDRVANGWYKLLHREHRWVDREDKPVMFVYVEWVERAKEINWAKAPPAVVSQLNTRFR